MTEALAWPAEPERARLRRIAIIDGRLTDVELAAELADRVAALGDAASDGVDKGGIVALEACAHLRQGGAAVLAPRIVTAPLTGAEGWP